VLEGDGVSVLEGVPELLGVDVILCVVEGVCERDGVFDGVGVFVGVFVGLGLKHWPSGSIQRVPLTDPPRGQLYVKSAGCDRVQVELDRLPPVGQS
jgi:hypothetical protein